MSLTILLRQGRRGLIALIAMLMYSFVGELERNWILHLEVTPILN